MTKGHRGEGEVKPIARLVVASVLQAEIAEADQLGETARGAGDFGATGVGDAALRQGVGGTA